MAFGFVDLHVHLLPGVDDGPPDLDATLELAGLEVADGVVAATATPHVASLDLAEIPSRVAEVNAALEKAHIPLVVEGGGELGARSVPRLSATELELIAHGPEGARWILLEAPLDGAVRTLHGAADQLRAAGYGIVLAHPERCLPLFDDDMRGLKRELERGTLAQVSSSSVLGLHGIRARRNAARILAGGHAGVLASDAHGPRRPPSLTAAMRAACGLGLPVAEAHALCADRPRALLQEGLRPGLAPGSGSSYAAGSDVSVTRRPPFGVAAAPS